jgi:membrane-bound serine protease (ClpP class)
MSNFGDPSPGQLTTLRGVLLSIAALMWIFTALYLATPRTAFAQGAPHVDIATVDTSIDTFTAGYIERVLSVAHDDGSQALIIQLDTPGGDLDATYNIIKDMLASPVPVVVYITPSGARAGSAGTFITYAATIAAMAPGTNIGAAHPVDISGGDITGTIGVKVTNDAVAHIVSLANQHGRNADWAEKAVRESVSVTSQQALAMHIVDIIANDIPDLLNQIDGRTVKVGDNREVTLHVRGVTTRDLEMNFFEVFFHTLLDPNIALILLNIGSLAILIELYSPGATLPAVTGVICLTLAAVALYNLPTNWAAVVLIAASIVMFVFDLKVNSFVLTGGGILAFVLGAFFLFRPFTPPQPTAPEVSVSPFVIGGLALMTAAFFTFALGAAVRSRRAPVVTGTTPFLGAYGVATTELVPGGTVRVRSEDWTATADKAPIHKGEQVKVLAVEGLRLRVTKVEDGHKPAK